MNNNIIKFKYNMNPDLVLLCKENIIEYDYTFLYGAMHEDITNSLNHASLYLICEDKTIQGNQFYANPLAIVANNDKQEIINFFILSNHLTYYTNEEIKELHK